MLPVSIMICQCLDEARAIGQLFSESTNIHLALHGGPFLTLFIVKAWAWFLFLLISITAPIKAAYASGPYGNLKLLLSGPLAGKCMHLFAERGCSSDATSPHALWLHLPTWCCEECEQVLSTSVHCCSGTLPMAE